METGAGEPGAAKYWLRKQHAAAQAAAARHGICLPDRAAEAIADAVLECADGEHRVAVEIPAAYRGDPRVARVTRDRLRRELAIELADGELLPTALPREIYVNDSVPWGMDKAELVVPVRRPGPRG